MVLRRKVFGNVVGVSRFVFRFADGANRRVQIRVGKPYEVSFREWACPVEIRGFEPRYPDIRGGDSVQALCLAITLVRLRIEDFIEKGGRVLDPDNGSEWDKRMLRAAFGQRTTTRRRHPESR